MILKRIKQYLISFTLILLLLSDSLCANEYLFDIYFRGIPGGNASLVVDYQEDRVFASFIIHSSGFVDTFYKVRDTTRIVASYPTYHTLKYDKRIHEGKYHSRRTFDVEMIDTEKLKYPVRDEYTTMIMLLDSLYFSTDSVTVSLWDRKDSVAVPFRLYKKEKDIINSPAGTYPTLVYKPDKNFREVFEDESDLAIWISESIPPLPVQMKIRLKFGPLVCVLRKVIP
ncbi:TPA: hypothetical protein DCG86_00235 [Candidatus Marinimicrobia bacterium]|nr:MAG: Uncharacterized protein XD77_0629 [Marinimicrobia bacterium 46_47]KUK93107.1 MAG: Uncharacterized protein XE04_0360 [Marinimicrobia bacterium 46_43]HAE86432.1 hypothetical protein [Candidatus Neomarinimicrobiota bacterium]